MAYPLGLTLKGLVGVVGAMGVTTGGVLFFNIGGESEFEVRVKPMIRDLGIRGWCVSLGNRFVCDGKRNKDGLKKVLFASKYNKGDKYRVEGNDNVGIEILESGDRKVFPNGVRFVVGNESNLFIKRVEGSRWPETVSTGTRAEFRFDEESRRLVWVWEEINDLTKEKGGLACRDKDDKQKEVSDCSLMEGRTINVRDGKKRVEGVTMDTSSVKLKFTRGQKGFFQGYKFVPQNDITLKLNGKEIDNGDKKKVSKLNKNSQYQMVRDSRDEMKWYLSRV